jgi:hypothetical protein
MLNVALFQALQGSALSVCTAKQMAKSLDFVAVGSECHARVGRMTSNNSVSAKPLESVRNTHSAALIAGSSP